MKKIIFAFAFLFLTSCGSVKKDKLSIDSKSELNEDINSSSNTNKLTYSKNFTLEPADLTAPMLWNNNGRIDTLWNTRIIENNTIIKEQKKDTTSVNKNEKQALKIDEKHKETDNTLLILGVVGILFLFFFLVIIFIVLHFSKQINEISKIIQKIEVK